MPKEITPDVTVDPISIAVGGTTHVIATIKNEDDKKINIRKVELFVIKRTGSCPIAIDVDEEHVTIEGGETWTREFDVAPSCGDESAVGSWLVELLVRLGGTSATTSDVAIAQFEVVE